MVIGLAQWYSLRPTTCLMVWQSVGGAGLNPIDVKISC